MQSLLRMCACSCVCVFIRVSLFKKQPSLWGSWILHVRVNPPVPCPPPLSPRPSLAHPSLPPLSSQPCCSLQRKGLWETPGLFPPIPQLLPAGAVCMPPPEPRGTPYPFPFPLSTKEKKEFQTTTRLCGLALYPKLCCQLARCRGRVPMEPRTEGSPQSCLAPHCSCLSLSFQPQHTLESSCPPEAFPMKLVSGLCSKNPSLRLPTLPPAWLDGSRPPGLTTAFRSAWVSQGPFFPVSGPSGWLWAGPSKPNLQQTC
ncbi:hypothetical protein mRhiFer1_009666 [Rhinolophus ferrumequinum]|uniref:Uncharacterized protein n=1 Tax=Rhinolophus ferrumequinum TaxID=59479 RepID=A0A7J7R5X9_RHIFE|nr:hypothetical protein mRhiFer1_009666 [Rhinolophus ferrumequinum]